jgi:hypothetical protein
MIALTADCFDDICNDPAVRQQIATLQGDGDGAKRRFWQPSLIGLATGAAAAAVLQHTGWPTLAALALIGPTFGGFLIGSLAESKFDAGLDKAAMEALAAKAGLDYQAVGFTPPAYADVRKALVGGGFSRDTFGDLFQGKDALGLNFATYQGSLGTTLHGDAALFTGQFYAMERRSIAATTILVSEGSFVSPFVPPKDMQRVAFDSDPEFDGAFEVYGTSGPEAWQLFSDAEFRRRLVALQEGGQLFAYVAPTEALVAVSGSDPDSPASAYGYRTPYEQLRPLVENMCGAFATLCDFKARFG